MNTYGVHQPGNSASLPSQPRWRPTPNGWFRERARIEGGLKRFLPKASAPHPMQEVGWSNLVIRCVASDFTMFLSAGSGNAAAGPVPFACHFVECFLIEENVLQMQRLPHIRPWHALPFGGPITSGMLQHYTHWDVAAVLLSASVSGRGPVFTCVRQHPANHEKTGNGDWVWMGST